MALVRRVLSHRLPLIVILGATGTGKTKLSVELAQKYQTEVISADSMQIYKGLDIITAKATPEERALAPHHFLDILLPHQTYTVVDFRNGALKTIDNLLAKNKMPIIVGGTSYYIESILWKVLVKDIEDSEKYTLVSERNKKGETEDGDKNVDKGESCSKGVKRNLEDEDSAQLNREDLHAKLKEVDPEMADRLHPNNRRKILRSLEIFSRTGKRHSTILEEQKSEEGGSGLGGPLRYPSSIVIWLHCEQKILDKRLTDRVDSMMKDGLVKELTDFHENYNKNRVVDGEPTDYTKGIFQSIGFKEFHDYLILSEEERQTERGKKIFDTSLENLNIATKRYARRQIKTIKNRLLGHPNRLVPPIYKLDTTDVSKWSVNVTEKALSLIDSLLEEKPCPLEPEAAVVGLNYRDGLNPYISKYCEKCERIFIGELQFNLHMKSNKHHKTVKRLKRLALKAKEGDADCEGGSSF